jgi:DNA polymerase alpha-associated DNA helicase A
MHEQICTFPSKTLYSSRLKSHESVSTHLLVDLPNVRAHAEQGRRPDEDELKEVLGTPVVFFDTAGCEYFERQDTDGDGDEGSKCNENEALVVKNWVERLVSKGDRCRASPGRS